MTALDAEIARREAPDYRWMERVEGRMTPARAMQRGELVGLKLARALLAAAVREPVDPEPRAQEPGR